MADVKDEINKNNEDIKNNTYGKKMVDKAHGYKTGAVIGGAAGFFAGWVFRGNILVYTVIGVVAGGYVGYKISENNEPKTNFKNYGVKEDK